MRRSVASEFLNRSFDPADRLAVVLIHRPSHSVIQRIAEVPAIAAPPFQTWLHDLNGGHDIYLSLNTIRPSATGRTKRDIDRIRHVFLDFDDDATARLRGLLSRDDIPKPSAIINSSRNHWQVIWQVSGFDLGQAEALQRGLTRETGADIAATDATRVFRLPGFLNHKYSPPWRVSVQHFHGVTAYGPEAFPQSAFVAQHQSALVHPADSVRRTPGRRTISQSERDWAFARRQLALGHPQDEVIAAISGNRTDKPNPEYYARLTVTKAARALEKDRKSQQYRNASGNGFSQT